jgi:hypothetical protein
MIGRLVSWVHRGSNKKGLYLPWEAEPGDFEKRDWVYS